MESYVRRPLTQRRPTMNFTPLFSRVRPHVPAAIGKPGCRPWALKVQCLIVALVFGIAAPALAAWIVQNGGLQDLSTGLVWSQSQYQETGSFWTLGVVGQRAANYVTYDRDINGNVTATYADWRLPTVKELQKAIANGTINQVIPRDAEGNPIFYTSFYYPTSEMRGKKYWVVRVEFDAATGQVIGGGETMLVTKESWFDAYFVRP